MNDDDRVTPLEEVASHVEGRLGLCFKIKPGSTTVAPTVVPKGDGIFMNSEEFELVIDTLYGKGLARNEVAAKRALETIGEVSRMIEFLKLGLVLHLNRSADDGRFKIYGKTTPTSKSGRRIAQLRWRENAPKVLSFNK